MPPTLQKAILSGLLSLIAVYGNAQTCQTASISANTATSRFVNHHDGTVTDAKTGLMWKKCPEGQSYNATTDVCQGSPVSYTWQGALQQAQTVNNGTGFAGFYDWHVPNQKELGSIVERQCISPAINLSVFPGTESAGFWSSATYAPNNSNAWVVSFNLGNDDAIGKIASTRVRLVRIGQ